MDTNAIKKIIPHRYPFLLIDRVTKLSMNREDPIGSRIEGIKAVSGNEPFFQGHFPSLPLMPGVLLVEAMAQLGGVLILKYAGEQKKHNFYLTGIDGARFRRPVVPGDLLQLSAEIVKKKATMWVVQSEIVADGQRVAETELSGTLVEV
ncbi:MAG: 3-hydroxyacyl-ACP dehydratase FabZ [Deltaproteobacteria bacterium]|nr:3-hydroxyacyl-ACP dehydratase FabZ [Deltaproteobacteria bacterium]